MNFNEHFKGEIVKHKFGQLMTVTEDCRLTDEFVHCQFSDITGALITTKFPRDDVSITLAGVAKIKIDL